MNEWMMINEWWINNDEWMMNEWWWYEWMNDDNDIMNV